MNIYKIFIIIKKMTHNFFIIILITIILFVLTVILKLLTYKHAKPMVILNDTISSKQEQTQTQYVPDEAQTQSLVQVEAQTQGFNRHRVPSSSTRRSTILVYHLRDIPPDCLNQMKNDAKKEASTLRRRNKRIYNSYPFRKK